jgi:hypothetical protein
MDLKVNFHHECRGGSNSSKNTLTEREISKIADRRAATTGWSGELLLDLPERIERRAGEIHHAALGAAATDMKKGRRSSRRPSAGGGCCCGRPRRRPLYLRFAEVKSTESLAMNVAPHQLDPRPRGLIADTLELPDAV